MPGRLSDRPAFQCRNISTKSVTFHDLLATSGPFQDPVVGHLNGANLSKHPNPRRTRPRVGNYVTAGGELRDGQPLKPGELRDR